MILDSAANDIVAAAVIGMAALIRSAWVRIGGVAVRVDAFEAQAKAQANFIEAQRLVSEGHAVRLAVLEKSIDTLATLSLDLKAVVNVSTKLTVLLETVHRRLEILEDLTIKKA